MPAGIHDRSHLKSNIVGQRFTRLVSLYPTDKFRGMLCGHCNTGLGMFKDSMEFLIKAVNYLRKENT